jgi:ATP-dependent exoDNAse (exonuclease V) beta subunit
VAIKFAWQLNGERQSSLGTALHRMCELHMNGNSQPPLPADFVFETPVMMDGSPLQVAYRELTSRHNLRDVDAARVLGSVGKVEPVAAPPAPPPREDVKEFEFYLDWRRKNPHIIPIRTEMNVWSEEMKLAGQIDALVFDSKQNIFAIYDWKRSKSMDYTAFGGRCGLPPFNDMPETNYSHYCLQQAIYAALLDKFYNISVKRAVLLQLHPNYDTWVEHDVPLSSLRSRIDLIFKDRTEEVAAEMAVARAFNSFPEDSSVSWFR